MNIFANRDKHHATNYHIKLLHVASYIMLVDAKVPNQ